MCDMRYVCYICMYTCVYICYICMLYMYRYMLYTYIYPYLPLPTPPLTLRHIKTLRERSTIGVLENASVFSSQTSGKTIM